VFYLENIFGAALDGERNGVAVSGAEQQGLEDEHVESALQHFALERRFALWHGRVFNLPLDGLLE